MATEMRAIRFHGKGDIRLEVVKSPQCGKNDVRIKPAYVGLCGTDIHEYQEGAYLIPKDPHPVTGVKAPVIIGHEYSGVVLEVGEDVADLEIGDRVVVQPIIYDGDCKSCQRGLINCRSNPGFLGLSGIGGGLADHTVVPRYSVFKIPDNLSLKVAALVEPLAVAWHAVKLSGFSANDDVLVLGAGPVGLAVLQVLKALGAKKVVVSELSRQRKKHALNFGATAALDPTKDDIASRCREICSEEGVQIVFDCVGNQSTFDASLAIARPRGVIVNIAVWTDQAVFQPNCFLLNERTYRGSSTYSAGDFQEVIDVLESGKLNPEPMITSLIEMEDIIQEGFEALIHHKEDHVKVLVKVRPE